MADETEVPQSVEAAAAHATADVVDATAQAAAQAQAAAAHVTEHATHIAAVATETAAERVAEIEQRTDSALNNQGNALADFMARTEQWQNEQTSRLTEAERRTEAALAAQAETAEQLRLIAERLTPPVLPEAPPVEPEAASQSSAGADGQRAAEPSTARRRHRVV